MEFAACAPSSIAVDDRNLFLRLQEWYNPTVLKSTALPSSSTVKGSLAEKWSKFEDGLELEHANPPAKFFVQRHSAVHTQLRNCAESSTMLLVEMEPNHDDPNNVLLNFPEGTYVKLQLENKPGALRHFKWLINYAAKLPELGDMWHTIPSSGHTTQCTTCVPAMPTLSWVEMELLDDQGNRKTKVKLVEDAEEAKEYEQAMKARPSTASAVIKRENGTLSIWIQSNFMALVHQTLAELDALSQPNLLEWRVTCLPQVDAIPSFEVQGLRSNGHMKPATSTFPLWKSQLKTLAWMKEKENTESPWREEILTEKCIPALGWSFQVKASRNPGIRGGVLADKVGAGKTKTTLELINQDSLGVARNDPSCFPNRGIGTHITTQATLILVPKNLIRQWTEEIQSVTGRQPCIVLKSSFDLKKITESAHIRDAKIILASLSLFEEDGYWGLHRLVTCAPNVPEKAGRALDEYLDDSLRSLGTMIEASQDGADKLAFWAKWDEAKALTGNYKRFSGVKTRASKKEEWKKARDAASQTKKRSSSSSSQSSRPRKKPRTAITGANNAAQAPQAANATTSSSTAKNEWVAISDEAFDIGENKDFDEEAQRFKARNKLIPVLHMFKFRRIVVDEFTYIQQTSLAALLRMEAEVRWLLSGTPPVHDYDSINTIAKLLGTKISVVDEGNGVHDFVKVVKDAKLRSQSEEFQDLQSVRSPGYFKHYYDRARVFVEEHIRQDESSQAKKGKTHKKCSFSGSTSELLDYADVAQILETQDCRFNVAPKTKKPKGRSESEIRDEYRQRHSGPAEALVCSMSDLASTRQDAGNPQISNPESILEAQEKSILDNCENLLEALQHLWYCNEHAYEASAKKSFHAFLSNFENLEVLDLDPSVVYLIDQILSFARSNPQEPESTFTQEPSSLPKSALRAAATHAAKIKDAETEGNAFKKLCPFYQSKEMDLRTTNVGEMIENIVTAFRRRRFVRCVLDLNEEETSKLESCSNCASTVAIDPHVVEKIKISGGCGHILACSNCPEDSPDLINCTDKLCCAAVGQEWPATFFVSDTTGDSSKVSRIQKAMDIIEEIPKDEFVLVFVQFDNMADQFIDACEEADVDYKDARSRVSSARMISEFKTAIEKDEKTAPKVLVLQIDSEDAAGWNLQCANHVLFLAPFVGECPALEWDTMVQAVGRAHRPGQQKPVVVYHLYAANTVEETMVSHVFERFERDD